MRYPPKIFVLRLFLLIGGLLLSGLARAQFPDSLPVRQLLDTDTVVAERQPLLIDGADTTINLTQRVNGKGKFSRFFSDNYPDPKKALLLSTIVPGAGQVYNGQWWKAPLAIGALGGAVYNVRFQSRRYLIFNEAYRSSIAGQEHEFTNTRLDNPQTLLRFRNRFNKSRQLAYVIGVAVYGLQALEAFVGAHLKDFDTEDDLGGWELRPLYLPDPTGGGIPAYGLVYSF